MGTNGLNMVWVGVNGNEVLAASNLKGLSEDIGVSYNVMKARSGDGKFTVAVGKMEAIRVWLVARVKVRRIEGRGGKRVSGSGGFHVKR